MPQAIVYCDRCGRIVPPGEIARGQALIGEGGGICQSCASTLTPEQREMLRLKLSGEMPAAGPAPRPATIRMAARDAAPARRMSTRLTAAMQTEPPARQGGGFQRNIAVVGAVAGVAVGVAIALLVASGGPDQGGTSGAGAGGTTPTDAPARPPDPVVTRPDEGAPQRSLAEIKAWAEDLPGRYSDIMIALKQLPISYPGTPEAAEAQALIQTYETRHAELAEAEFAKAVAEAKARVAGDGALEAPRLFEDLRLRFAGTTWFATRGEAAIRAAAGEVEAAVEAARRAALAVAAKDALARAGKSFEEGDLEAAKRELAAYAGWPEPERARAEELLGRIDEKLARAAAEAEKTRRAEEAWRAFLVELFTGGKEGLSEPGALIGRSRAVLEELGKGKDLARFDSRLREARNVEDLAAIGFEGSRRVVRLQWKGKPVGGRVVSVKDGVMRLKPPTVGEALDVPVAELAPGNIVDDSGLKLKPAEAAVYFMMRGDLDEARKRLADADGEKARALRDEIEGIAALIAPPPPEPEPATIVEAPPATPGIALVSAGAPLGGWTFDNGREFPGAKGALALDDTVPPARRPALKLDGDFTGGGSYVQAGLNLPPTAVEAVTFAVRAPGAGLVTMRLVDSSDQCHQIRLKLARTDDWQEIRFPVDAFFRRVGAGASLDTVINYEKWGGPNDSRWHGPAKGVYMLLGKGEMGGATTGSMWLSGVSLVPAEEPTPGLVGWWKLDEPAGNLAPDSSGKGRDGDVRGASWDPAGGRLGGALRLGGDRQFAEIPRPVQDDFTIAFWVRTTCPGGTTPRWYEGTGLVDGEVAGPADDFGTSLVQGRFAFGVGGAGDKTVCSKRKINDGAWHHVAATRVKNTGEMKVYVDGSLEGEDVGSRNALARPPRLTVGCLQTDQNYFEGWIDDVRIYEQPLSGAEVKALVGGPRRAAVPAAPPGLVAWYRLDESQGQSAGDSSGKGRNASLRGGSWRAGGGRAGGGLALNGNGDFMVTPDLSADMRTGSVTIALWIRPEEGGVIAAELGGDSLNQEGWHYSKIEVMGDGEVRGRVWQLAPMSLGKASFGSWSHVALRYDAASRRVEGFVNGVKSGAVTEGDRDVPWTYGKPLHYAFGGADSANMGDGSFFRGLLDEVMICGRALSDDEVRALAGLGPAAAAAPEVKKGLLAWWKFDEAAGATISDHSGKGVNGTLRGGEWRPTGGKLGGALASGVAPASAAFPGPSGPMPRFSVAFWLNPGELRDHNQQIGAEGGWGRFSFHAGAGGSAWCGISVGSRFETEDLFPGIVETGKWQHFAFTYDNGPSRFYKDGALVASKTLAAPEDWRGFTFYDVSGAIDDLRIYDRPLDAAEVRSLAGGVLSAPKGAPRAAGGGLVAHLKLDEKDGAVVADASGNGTGGMIGTVGGGGYAWRPEGGKTGGALELSYSKVAGQNRTEGASIDLGNALGLNPSDAVTVACWMKAKTQGGYGFYWPGLVTKPGQYQLRLHEVNNLAFEVWLAGGTSAKVTVPSPPSGEWHHVAGSYDGAEVRVFVDGQLKGSSPAAGRIAVTASGALVGVAPGNEPKYYDGLLDEVRVYGRALGAAEVLALLDPKAAPETRYLTGLFGEYFEGKDPDPTKLKLSRVDMNVDHDWGGGAPAPGMPGDNFSVHWSGELKVPADGTYTFDVERDDGARMRIGGKLVIDKWADTGGRDAASVALKEGWVPFDFTYKENGGNARIRLWWSGPGVAKSVVTKEHFRTARDPDAAAKAALSAGPEEPLPGETGETGGWAPGLVCEIFKGFSLIERVGVRIDPCVDFDFGECAPDLGLDAGPYVLRWTGYLLAPYDGIYKFEPEGVAIRLDGQAAPANSDFEMTRGLHRLEAIAATGAGKGKVIFRWRLAGAKDRRDVPSSHYFHDVPELGSMGPPAKVVVGLGAKYFPGEVPRGRAIEGVAAGPEYDLGESPPCTKLVNNRDQFSVRLEGYFMARAGGKYIFQLVADDGAQFFLDDKLAIDCWQKAADDPTATLEIKAGWHKLAVLHREHRGTAKLELRWRPPWGRDDKGKPVFEWWPGNCLFREPGKPELVDRKGVAPGIDCVVYEGDRPGAGRKLVERLDPHLEFDWKDDKPGPDVPDTGFSASWRGSLLVPASGAYIFSVWRRGGLQLAVGSTNLVREWSQGDGWTVTKPVSLRAGAVPLALDYFSQQGDSSAKIYWTGPSFQLRRLGDGDLVRKAKELELAAPWWKKPDQTATATAKPPATKPGPGPGPSPDGKAEKPLPAGNLVPNGGFEEKDAESKFAARWTKGQWGERGARSSVRVDMSNPREGGQSALVARAMEAGAKAGASTTLKLDPGTYRVSFWACANAGETATVGAHFAGKDLAEESVGDQWKQISHEVQVKQKTVTGAFRFWTSGLNVRVWFDDVEVVMLKRAEPEAE